jgi:hypothetical protein
VVLLIALTALAAGGCTKDTPGFCCSSVESCAGTGTASVVMCDPAGSRPVCDDLGAHGPAHTCIPDPTAPGCESSLECLTPERPVCDIDDTGTCIGCANENDCTRFEEQRLCHPQTRACVQCVSNGDCMTAAAPICADDGMCRGCSADTQCPSGVCDEEVGSCVLDADIIYVNRTSGGGTACTMASPCATITAGVAAITSTRRYMRVSAEDYMESVVLDGVTLTIIAPGTGLQAGGLNEPALRVLNAATVRIEGMRLHDGGGGTSADGLRCLAPAGGTPTVTMIGTRIDGNGGFGIDADECNIKIDRGEIFGNPGGGISIQAGTFDIVNTFVTGNGGAGTPIGGVRLMDNDAMASRFEFNTVAGNVSGGGAQALICSSVQNQRIANNILFGAGADQVSETQCDLAYNLSNENLGGGDNIEGAPTFVGASNFHLMAGSEGIDDGDPDATMTVDFDGDLRPQGGRRDIGADEVRP